MHCSSQYKCVTLYIGHWQEHRIIYKDITSNTVWCCYNVWCHYNIVNFLQNLHTTHPIAHPLGLDMGVSCGLILWFIFCLSHCSDICGHITTIDHVIMAPGGRLDIKTMSYHYRDPHVKDKTVSRLSYLQHGNPHTWKDGLYIETGSRLHVHICDFSD